MITANTIISMVIMSIRTMSTIIRTAATMTITARIIMRITASISVTS